MDYEHTFVNSMRPLIQQLLKLPPIDLVTMEYSSSSLRLWFPPIVKLVTSLIIIFYLELEESLLEHGYSTITSRKRIKFMVDSEY